MKKVYFLMFLFDCLVAVVFPKPVEVKYCFKNFQIGNL
jgi:hypothetical protein